MRVESIFRPFVVNRADKKQHNRGGSGWQMAWENDAHQGGGGKKHGDHGLSHMETASRLTRNLSPASIMAMAPDSHRPCGSGRGVPPL